MKKSTVRPESYRWVIVVCSVLVFSTTIGLGYNCWSVFTIPMCEDLDLTRQQFSGLFTVLLAGQTLGALMTDRLIARLGMMPFMRIGVLGTAAAMFLIPQVRTVSGLYTAGLLIGFFLSATSFLPFSVLMANWFVRLRGLMTGLVFMSSCMLSMVLLPIVTRWIGAWGWQRTAFVMAAILGTVALPLTFFILKADPRDVGLLPYGNDDPARRELAQDDSWGFTARELLGQPSFWLFLLFTLGIYLETTMSNTIIPYLTDEGFTPERAAAVQSISFGGLALMRLCAGRLCDWLGSVRATFLFTVVTPLMAVGLLGVPAFPAAVGLIIVGQGFGESETTVCYPMLIGHLFGRKHFTSIYGIITAFSNLVSAVTPLLFGAIYSWANSYRPAYWIFGGVYLVGAASLWAVIRLCVAKPAYISNQDSR